MTPNIKYLLNDSVLIGRKNEPYLFNCDIHTWEPGTHLVAVYLIVDDVHTWIKNLHPPKELRKNKEILNWTIEQMKEELYY